MFHPAIELSEYGFEKSGIDEIELVGEYIPGLQMKKFNIETLKRAFEKVLWISSSSP